MPTAGAISAAATIITKQAAGLITCGTDTVMAQFAAAMRCMNVAVDLQNPQQLRVSEVREGCTDWLLRQFSDAPGTKNTTLL
jgi:hypothetical protein